MGLGVLDEGDGKSERLDLPDVIAELAVFAGAVLVIGVAGSGEPGGGLGRQVPVALCRPSWR